MGQLANLYAAIAALTPTFSPAVTTFAPGNLPIKVDDTALPMRLMIPLGADADAKQGQFVALGSARSLSWTIPDLFLLQHPNQGEGINQFAAQLIAYCDAYSDLLSSMRYFGSAQGCKLDSWSISPGIYEFPRNTNMWFAGVLVLLQYSEYLT
jgi:hypothetical protein